MNLLDITKNDITVNKQLNLENTLHTQLQNKEVQGEQWFRDFKNWLLIVFNNPLNFKYPNSELILLINNSKEIYKYIENHQQIHFGVGVGETELEVTRWQLEKHNYLEVCAIDINYTFLDFFKENLKYKQIEYNSNIKFKGYNDLFQNINKLKTTFNNSKLKDKVIVCIGGTIGNFKDQDEIFNLFSNNLNKGDKLLLGFQLDTYLEQTFEKYKTNKFYPQFGVFWENIDKSKIKWVIKDNFVTLYYNNIDVFRSKKYNLEEVINYCKKHNLTYLNSWKDKYNNSCIAIFTKN